MHSYSPVAMNRSKGGICSFRHEPWFTAFLYFTSLAALTTLHKTLFMRFYFDYTVFLLGVEYFAALLFLEVMKLFKVVTVSFTLDYGRDMILPSVCLCMNQLFVMNSFSGVHIPMFHLLRGFAPLLNVYMVTSYHKRSLPSGKMLISIALVTLGTLIAKYEEFEFDLWAWFYGIMSIAALCIYLNVIEHHYGINSTNFNPWNQAYVHCFNAVILLILVDLVDDEYRDAFVYIYTSASHIFVFVFIVTILVGVWSIIQLFFATCATSALSMSVALNYVSTFDVIVSWILGKGFFILMAPAFFNLFGCIVTLVGFVIFGYVKLNERKP